MEGETLYNTTWEVPSNDGEELLIPIGKGDVKRTGKDITLIAWSKMVWTCLDAAKALAEEGIDCEVVDPRTLRPLDVPLLVESVTKTGRCVIVEIGWPVAGFGAEVAYQLQRHCLDALDAPIERVTSDDVPMPYAKNLEDEVQPQVADVVAAVKRALYLE
jgi:pyruvate dehydrogenase E1 component beta subunit